MRRLIAAALAALAGLVLLAGGETIDWRRAVIRQVAPTAPAAKAPPAEAPLAPATSPALDGWALARSGSRLELGLLVPEGGPVDGPSPANVYARFLEDEGYPYRTLTEAQVAALGPAGLARECAAVLLPEGTLGQMSPAVAKVLATYVRERGGRLMGAWGAGLDRLPPEGDARARTAVSALFDLFGVAPLEDAPITRSQWVLPSWSPLAAYVDTGSLNGAVFRPYGSRPTESPRQAMLKGRARVLAPDVFESSYPRGGRALLIDGYLAAEKQAGNDSLFRGLVKFFLDGVARMPRVTRAPGGVAGLVINVHVCSSAYFGTLDRLLRMGAFGPRYPVSFHFTPGPDTYQPGDGLGVYAASPRKGRPFVEKVAAFGAVGAHGGWIHNYWAYESARLPWATKKKYLDDSLDVLAGVTGRPVVEYSAPGGTHDLLTDDYLVQRGVVAAAYPGGENAPPSHSWVEGRRLSPIWHFGYTGDQRGFCPENMLTPGRTPEQVAEEVRAIVARVAESREIRLFYLHPLVAGKYPAVWRALAGEVARQAQAGRLTVATMSDYATFLDRAGRTRLDVRRSGTGLAIEVEGQASLAGVTLAVPLAGETAEAKASAAYRLSLDTGGGWAYLTVDEPVTRFVAVLTPAP